MSRSKKLDVSDVMQYLQENEVKLEVGSMGKRGTNLTVFLKVGLARTPLSQDATVPILSALANLMVATGHHARKNL